MKKTIKLALMAFVMMSTVSFPVFASSVYIPAPLFTHERSMVDSSGILTVSADYAPIYQHSLGLLPRNWSMVFSADRHALAPIRWGAGERWVEVLDYWAKRQQANVMIDSATRRIVVTSEQTRRPAGILFVNSQNVLHQEMHNPQAMYEDAERHVINRFISLSGTNRDDISVMQMQANLFHAAKVQEEMVKRVEAHASTQTAGREEAKRTAGLPVDVVVEPNRVERIGRLSIFENGQVAYDMRSGGLRHQVTQMLIDAGRVSTHSDVVWEVSDNHRWSNDFTVHGETFDHLIGRVLATYRMAVIYRANNVAVIRYIERG